MRGRRTAVLLWAAACGMPSEGGFGSESTGSSDPSSSSASSAIGTTVDATGSSAASSDGSDDSTGGGIAMDVGTTTGPVDSACKDGIVAAGELCLELEYVYPVADNPRTLAIADLEDDGALDLLVGSDNTAPITVLHGAGDGSFGIPEAFTSAATKSDFVLFAALDGDALPDLVVIDADQTNLHAHLNTAGTFGPSSLTDFGSTPTDAATGDLDGDGLDDVVFVANNSGVTVLHNEGGFGTFTVRQTIPIQIGGRGIVLGDLDQNGWLDVVTANGTANNASVIYNMLGTLTAAIDPLTTEMDPRAITLADVSEDGWLDVVAVNFGSDSVSMRLADPMAGFVDDPLTVMVDDEPSAVLVTDFDGDDHLDLAVAHQGMADTVAILRGEGANKFADPIELAVGNDPVDLVAGDFDSDGVTDLAVITGHDDELAVLLADP